RDDADRDASDVAAEPAAALDELDLRGRTARLRVDHVPGVGRVVDAADGVRRLLVDLSRDLLVEEDLTRVDGAAADVHLHVDVRRPASVPAGKDREELRAAGGVGLLVAAEEPRLRAVDGGV